MGRGGRESQENICILTVGSCYSRKQHNIVKQLSSKQNKLKKKRKYWGMEVWKSQKYTFSLKKKILNNCYKEWSICMCTDMEWSPKGIWLNEKKKEITK